MGSCEASGPDTGGNDGAGGGTDGTGGRGANSSTPFQSEKPAAFQARKGRHCLCRASACRSRREEREEKENEGEGKETREPQDKASQIGRARPRRWAHKGNGQKPKPEEAHPQPRPSQETTMSGERCEETAARVRPRALSLMLAESEHDEEVVARREALASSRERREGKASGSRATSPA